MSKFDEFTKKLGDLVDKAADGAKDFAEDAKNKLMIEKYEIEQGKLFKDYGKSIYEATKQGADPKSFIDELALKVDEIEAKIVQLKEELADKVEEIKDDVVDKAQEVKEDVAEKAEEVKDEIVQAVEKEV